jgi:hypothetical protein
MPSRYFGPVFTETGQSRVGLAHDMRENETRYTPNEVRARLRQDPTRDNRTAAVHAVTSEVGAWTSRLSPKNAHELGRSADRLPSAVFWYVRGHSNDDIGRRLRPLGGAWDAELALNVATFLIAAILNERTVASTARTLRSDAN